MRVPDATRISPVWIRVGTVLDGVCEQPRRDVHVVYDADRIRAVNDHPEAPPAAQVRPGQVAPDAWLPHATLLPGLIDGHAHLAIAGGELDPGERSAARASGAEALLLAAEERLDKLVRLGITAVRDAGDRDGVGLALSRLFRSAARPLMPYVDSPGAAIYREGHYGGFIGEPLEAHPSPADCVAARVAAGADRIKVIATGVVDVRVGAVTAEPQMTAVDMAQIVEAARALGRQTYAHASGDAGIEHVIEGGVHSLEHGFFVRDDQLARMRDRRIAWVPTLAPIHAQIVHADRLRWTARAVDGLRAILARHAESLLRAHALGVPIVAGSDAGAYGVPHGLGLLDELEWMEQAGLPPIAAINAATGSSASCLAFRDPIGRVAVGYASRLLVTDHDPLAGVSALRLPHTVIFDGAVVSGDGDSDTDHLGL